MAREGSACASAAADDNMPASGIGLVGSLRGTVAGGPSTGRQLIVRLRRQPKGRVVAGIEGAAPTGESRRSITLRAAGVVVQRECLCAV